MARTITFLRHGQTVGPDGVAVKDRRLSPKGKRQAEQRREQLGNPVFDLILTSQIIRTAETALVVAGEDNTAPVIMLYELFTPHSGPQKEVLDRLFSILIHSPLSTYYDSDLSDVTQMKEFGATGWEVIIDEIDNFAAEHILVVGHGNFLVSMVHAAFPEKAGCLMGLVQHECDGFMVLFDENGVIANITPLPKLE